MKVKTEEKVKHKTIILNKEKFLYKAIKQCSRNMENFLQAGVYRI